MVSANGQVGILRYFGPIQHCDGLYCGIELDKPIGLHDGQFGGTRYFQTGFKRGTFSPMDKVKILDLEAPSSSAVDGPAVQAMAYDQKATLWPGDDEELLTNVEPVLFDRTMEDSMMTNSAATFDLSSSLSFMKGSRFPGMDISMTPSELATQLVRGGGNLSLDNEREAMFANDGTEMLVDIDDGSGTVFA